MRSFAPYARKATLSLLVLALPLSVGLGTNATAVAPAQAPGGDGHDPQIGAQTKNVLTVHGKRFKDSNGNGRLDRYEDWRLPAEQRAADLVTRMTLQEKAGLMLADSLYMGSSRSCPAGPGNGLLCETGNGRSGAEATFGTTKRIQDLGERYFIIRDNPTAKDLATWINRVQEVAENTRLGIPAMMVSNPRNHVNPDQVFGISEATGQFSTWPGTLGLAATADPALVKEFAQIAAKEWVASGIHKGYMYQADVATEPRWTRVSGTFGESPQLVAEITKSLVEGFQGKKLGPDGVSMTVKHFPGDGAVDKGLDPHFAPGRFATYPTPGSLTKYQLPSFKAAIKAGTTSIMSYYNAPSNALSVPQLKGGAPFEEVGGAYNKAIITDLLRKQLGFKGYVNTDSGIMTTTPWGVEGLTVPQRYAKALNAGSNLFSVTGDPALLVQAVTSGLAPESRLTESAQMLLTELFRAGAFENPYVDPGRAQAIATDPASQAKADDANRKSVVLLRNDRGLLPLTDSKARSGKLFVEVVTKTGGAAQTEALKALIRRTDPSMVLTDNLDEATHALVWARPNTFTVSDAEGQSLELNADTGIDVARIKAIEAAAPTALAVNLTNPWIIKDIEAGAAAVLGTFDVKSEALLDVVRGRFAPTGKLPITLPADKHAVDISKPDVPGYDEGPGYVYRDHNGTAYGLGYGASYRTVR
ncbi:glycoside hydrolase family 3 protein [Streptomyces sp. NPDC057582]|uniref:glycoside hydrolase family 3 protein n=1 Tax=Streptomyces sp. NPDC057582 TaxID=3346174 RepID=UPI0036980C9D